MMVMRNKGGATLQTSSRCVKQWDRIGAAHLGHGTTSLTRYGFAGARRSRAFPLSTTLPQGKATGARQSRSSALWDRTNYAFPLLRSVEPKPKQPPFPHVHAALALRFHVSDL